MLLIYFTNFNLKSGHVELKKLRLCQQDVRTRTAASAGPVADTKTRHLLLRHPLQGLERGLHVGLGQAHQQAVVFHADLVDGLAAALLQTPLQLRGQMLEAVLGGINQLQLERSRLIRLDHFNDYLIQVS